MHLDVGTVTFRQFGGHLGQRDDAMRVADGGGGKPKRAILDGEGLVEHFARRTRDGNPGAIEAHGAHRDRDPVAVEDLRLDHSAGSLDREARRLHQPLVPEESGEDAQPVAAFLRLGTVGIEHAHPEVGPGGGERSPEDAVRSNPEIAVADRADLVGLRRIAEEVVARIEDQVVVAEGVILVKAHDRWTH